MKNEKLIAKTSQRIEKHRSTFSDMVAESDAAIEKYDEVIDSLVVEIAEREQLIASAAQEREIAIAFKKNISALMA